MTTTEAIRGNWNRIQGELERRWGQLKDDNLERFQGNADALVGEIQRKTGETRESIENYIEHLTAEAASAASRVGDAAKQYASKAAGVAAAVPEQVAEGARVGYQSVRRTIRHHPTQSLAVAFVTGLIAGVAVGWTIRSR